MVRKTRKDYDDEDDTEVTMRELTAEEYRDFIRMRKDWQSATAITTAIYRLVIAVGAVAAAIAAIKVTFGQWLSKVLAP